MLLTLYVIEEGHNGNSKIEWFAVISFASFSLEDSFFWACKTNDF